MDDLNHQPLYREKFVGVLKPGQYFGEIALLTNLQRTATVKAIEFMTVAVLEKQDFDDLNVEHPEIFNKFRSKIKEYDDDDFEARREYTRNVPYLKTLSYRVIE